MQNVKFLRILKHIALLICIALISFLPSLHFMPKEIIWFHDGQRLLEIIILCIVLLYSTFNKNFGEPIILIEYWLVYAFTALIVLSILSSLLAISPRHAFIEATIFVGLSYLALIIATSYRMNSEVFIKRLVYIAWGSILLYMVSFYVGYTTATIVKKPLVWPLPFTGFSNIRSFNQYQLWAIGLLCLPLLAFELKPKVRNWLYVALTFWWVLLFYSASRGVLIAWLLGITVTALIYKKLAWPFIRIQLINILSGLFTYFALFTVIPKLNGSTLVTGTVLRETANDRIDLWHKALTLAIEYPWLGVGPMHYAWHNTTSAHPHNSILQLAAEFGIPATLIILSIAGFGIYAWLIKFNSLQLVKENLVNKNFSIILIFTITTNAIYSLVDGVIVMPISQVMMFATIGLMVGHYAYTNPSYTKKSHTLSHGKFNLLAFFALLTLVTLAWSTFPEIAQGLSGHEKGFSTGQSAIGPRLWREVN